LFILIISSLQFSLLLGCFRPFVFGYRVKFAHRMFGAVVATRSERFALDARRKHSAFTVGGAGRRHSGAPILRRYAAASGSLFRMAHPSAVVPLLQTQRVSGRLRLRQGLRHLLLAATSAFDDTSTRHVSTKPFQAEFIRGVH
jgi:hypothetical protein